MIRVAVDAMGGDSAPQAEIAGVVEALTRCPTISSSSSSGGPTRSRRSSPATPASTAPASTSIEAPDVIGMGEKPLAAVRRKPELQHRRRASPFRRTGSSDAFVSAGNTGAILAASTVLLGLHEGVERATVATLFPTGGEPVLVLDGGANLDCLRQRARRLRAPRYGLPPRPLRPRQRPVVGLLNVGEEEEKGTAVVREAHRAAQADRGHQLRRQHRGTRHSARDRSNGCRSMSWCATASSATSSSSSTSRRPGSSSA